VAVAVPDVAAASRGYRDLPEAESRRHPGDSNAREFRPVENLTIEQ